MKRLCTCLLILALCVSVLPAGVQAKELELSDLTYTIENGEVTITDCDTKVSGVVQLPDVIEGYPVTEIGKNAFAHCYAITQMTIPEGVHTIGGGAFAHITWLKELYLPDSILRIGENALVGCSQLRYNQYDNAKYLGNKDHPYLVLVAAKDQKITSCIIHENTKVIGACAFESCQNLLSIDFPASIVTIGYAAFYQCTSLNVKAMGAGVTEVGNLAFYNCKMEHSFYGAGSYFAKGEHSFYYLTGHRLNYAATRLVVHPETKVLTSYALSYSPMTDITLPEGLVLIRPNVFFSCHNLSQITIPSSVTEIGKEAFGNCKRLTSIYFVGDAPTIGTEAFEDLVATVYYHPGTEGWNEQTMQSYGGDITWVESHFYNHGICSVCGQSETGEIPVYTALSGSVKTFGDGQPMIELYFNGDVTPARVLQATDVYQMEALLTGEYVLTISKDNHVSRSYTVTLGEEASVLNLKLHPLGDITGDGKKNVGDVSKIYSHIKKTSLITDEYVLLCADLTGDGRINIGDTAEAYASIKYNP